MVMKICRMNNIKEELETLSFRYVPLRKRYAKLYQVFFYCYCFFEGDSAIEYYCTNFIK